MTPRLAPNIIGQPASSSVNGGQPASFTIAATGIPDPSYQWLKNGTNIPGATGPTLSLASAYVGDAGTYSVVVSNAAGVVSSSSAILSVGNTAPTLATYTDAIINAGAILNVASVATDPDVPPQILAFTLVSGPTNATLDASSGLFAWRPLVSQANTTNLVTIKVADDGSPTLSASQSFQVVVEPLTKPILSSSSYANGEFSLTVEGGTVGPDYTLLASTNLNDWQVLFTSNSPALPLVLTDTNAINFPARFYRIQLRP